VLQPKFATLASFTGHSIHYRDLIFPEFHRDTVFDS